MLFKKICINVLFGFTLLMPLATYAQKIELRSAKIYIRETPPKWDRASALLETALQKDPGNNEAHYLLGLINYYRGNFGEMFKHWEASTFKDLDRKNKNQYKDTLNSMVRGNYARGKQSYEKGEFTEATNYYQTTVKATSLLQKALHSTGKKKDAKTALELEPAKQQGYLYWGYAALGASDFDNARIALEKLLEVDPNKFEAWDGLINVYYTSESWAKLIEACNKVIELSEKTDLNTYLILRNAYFGTGDTTNVVTTYERAIEEFPGEQSLYVDLSSLHDSRKNQDKAIEVLEKGNGALPENIELLKYLGITYYNNGLAARDASDNESASLAFHGAVSNMEKLLLLQPKNIDGTDILSDAYYGLASIETVAAQKEIFSSKGQELQKAKLDLITSGEGI